jgi:hypothetical protein
VKHEKEPMDEYKSRLSAYLTDMIREELEKYDGGYTDEWNDQRKKNAEVLGYKLSGRSDIKEAKSRLQSLKDWGKMSDRERSDKIDKYYPKKTRLASLKIWKKLSDRERSDNIVKVMNESVNEKRIKNSPLRRNITSTFKDLDKKFRKKLTSHDIDSVASYITSKNRYFPKELANVAAEYFYEYKRRKLKINQAIQATINYQRGYPYKSYRTGTELESVNEGFTKYHIRLTDTPGWYGVWDKKGKQKFEGDKRFVTKQLKKLKTRMGNYQLKSLIDVATKRKGKDIEFDVVESVNEGGMGILDKDQTDVLHGIVMKNKNKNSKAILSIAMKDRMFKGVDKKELLGYIEGAKQFVRYMGRTGNESVKEERDYKAEYKKYGSSIKAKKYRAELNQYNRKKGTYGNNGGKKGN